MAEGIRLNKALADAGLCSRRKADELIFSGAVNVNGQRAEIPGIRVSHHDRITVHGKPVLLRREEEEVCWLMLHKPVHVLSTVFDPEGRETVVDLLPQQWRDKRLYPVGRLDYFSEGLLLLTNDGELAHRLTHPRWHLSKVYHVLIRPDGGRDTVLPALARMKRGMTLAEGERLAPVEVRILSADERGVLLEMVLYQGLNRQIRRMCRDVQFTVLRLKRVQEGPVKLGALPSRKVRSLSAAEVDDLRRAVGL